MKRHFICSWKAQPPFAKVTHWWFEYSSSEVVTPLAATTARQWLLIDEMNRGSSCCVICVTLFQKLTDVTLQSSEILLLRQGGYPPFHKAPNTLNGVKVRVFSREKDDRDVCADEAACSWFALASWHVTLSWTNVIRPFALKGGISNFLLVAQSV